MEVVTRLRSFYLENERSIWICEPRNIVNAGNLVVFLDGELLGHSVMYHEFDGDHDYKCWNRTLSNALRWCLPPESNK